MATNALPLGSTPLTAVYSGPIEVQKIYNGSTLLWSAPAAVGEIFTELGILENWIIDGLGAIAPGLGGTTVPLVFDGIDHLVTGLGEVVGAITIFIPGLAGIQQALFGTSTAGTNLGVLASPIPTTLESTVCAGLSLAQSTVESILNNIATGITGFLNGIPIVGGIIEDIETILGGGLSGITSLIGLNGVTSPLAQAIGLIANDVTGLLSNPVNFITDALGNVVAYLTCGQYTTTDPTTTDIQFPIGVVGNMALPLMPQGLVALPTQTSFARYNGLSAADNGWVATSPTTVGAPGLVTQVFRRWDNSGSAASGVGIDLRSSVVSIVRRVDNANTLVAPALGNFTPGDTLVLSQYGDTHTMIRNGVPIGQWVDNTGTALMGAENRSIAMTQQFGQQRLGPSQYSAGLSYVIGT
jgi:hypothetical protein